MTTKAPTSGRYVDLEDTQLNDLLSGDLDPETFLLG
jgi:hypothetical protein